VVSDEVNGGHERAGAFTGAPVTFYVLLANVALFAGEVIASRSLASLVVVPSEVLIRLGGNYEPLTIDLGQYYLLVTSCFLHASLLHLALNMWALGQIGRYAEHQVGSARYAVMYVVTGIAGSAASVFWATVRGEPFFPSVGASGAICGVMGAALVVGVRLEGWRSGIAAQIGFWLLVTLAYGAKMPDVDNAAHVGGIVAGCLIAMLWRRGVHYSKLATVVSIGLAAAVCVGSGAAVLIRNADPYGRLDPNHRGYLVDHALDRRDCVEARQALRATEAVSPRTPELEGLRQRVHQQCP
jgi:rhomboid protease GluP